MTLDRKVGDHTIVAVILLVLAVICFVLAAVGFKASDLNFFYAGWAFAVASVLF